MTALTVPAVPSDAGQTITVSWTVSNVGNDGTYALDSEAQILRAENPWIDRVYLSRDASLDPSDWLLDELKHSFVLVSSPLLALDFHVVG